MLATVGFFTLNVNAQNESFKEKIENLEGQKEKVVQQERAKLKEEVEKIIQQQQDGEITKAQAEVLKRDAAEKRARNIEDQLAIIDSQIDLYKRNQKDYEETENSGLSIHIFGKNKTFKWSNSDDDDDYEKAVIYDRRTYSQLVVAIGLNNAIIEGESLEDSPYKIGGSRFFELGWAWKTRVFDNSNWLRFKYGFSFQFNGLKLDDNQYYVEQGDQTVLTTYPLDLDKAKLRMDHLVFPIHFEIGSSKKIEKEDYFRYSTINKFKFGFGGYAGLNLLTIQKLKYKENGSDKKDKFKTNYNTNNFIYGLSSYVAWGSTALYVKYDLNTIFKDNATEQRNISVGLRFDME